MRRKTLIAAAILLGATQHGYAQTTGMTLEEAHAMLLMCKMYGGCTPLLKDAATTAIQRCEQAPNPDNCVSEFWAERSVYLRSHPEKAEPLAPRRDLPTVLYGGSR